MGPKVTEEEACVWCSAPCLSWAPCLTHGRPGRGRPRRVRTFRFEDRTSEWRRERQALGLCCVCDEPAVNRSHCARCRDRHNASVRRSRERKRVSGR